MKLLISILTVFALMVLPSFAKSDKKEKSYKNSEMSMDKANENAKFKRDDGEKAKKKSDDDDEDKVKKAKKKSDDDENEKNDEDKVKKAKKAKK